MPDDGRSAIDVDGSMNTSRTSGPATLSSAGFRRGPTPFSEAIGA